MPDKRTTERVAFAAAGTKMREAIDRLANSEHLLPSKVTSGMAWKMLAFVLRDTASWSKTAEFTFQEHLIDAYGINDRDGRRILKALAELGVIGWHASESHGRKSLLVLAPSDRAEKIGEPAQEPEPDEPVARCGKWVTDSQMCGKPAVVGTPPFAFCKEHSASA